MLVANIIVAPELANAKLVYGRSNVFANVSVPIMSSTGAEFCYVNYTTTRPDTLRMISASIAVATVINPPSAPYYCSITAGVRASNRTGTIGALGTQGYRPLTTPYTYGSTISLVVIDSEPIPAGTAISYYVQLSLSGAACYSAGGSSTAMQGCNALVEEMTQ